MSRDEEQIRPLVQTWQAATIAGDVDTVLGLMTDDAVFLTPGRPPLGKSEFAQLARTPAGRPRPKLEIRSQIQEIQVSGDWAYMWTQLAVAVTPPGGKQASERAGHTLTVLRRVDGVWRLARDANLLAPVPSPNP